MPTKEVENIERGLGPFTLRYQKGSSFVSSLSQSGYGNSVGFGRQYLELADNRMGAVDEAPGVNLGPVGGSRKERAAHPFG